MAGTVVYRKTSNSGFSHIRKLYYKPFYKGQDSRSQNNSYNTCILSLPKRKTSLQRTNQLNVCRPQKCLYSEVHIV